MPPPRRRLPEQLQAWFVTGPIGHLWSVLADITILLLRYGAARIRGRRA